MSEKLVVRAYTTACARTAENVFSCKRAAQKIMYADLVALRNLGCAVSLADLSSNRQESGDECQDSVSQHFMGIASSYKEADTESVAYRFRNKSCAIRKKQCMPIQ